MKSKRYRILSAIGAAAISSGMFCATETRAAEPFTSEAGFVAPAAFVDSGDQSTPELEQVGFLDAGCDASQSCDEYPCMEMDDACGCDAGCGCDECGGGGVMGEMMACNLGEPFALFGEAGGYTAGGWVQMGYHSDANPLFNAHPNRFNLHQAWLYAEKSLDTSNGFDFGGRIDYVYGIDAQDTQAFGIANGHWDTGWVNGVYGHALPQVYGEAGYGDLSVKFGHFFTTIGWEVVPAPDNFFYSHAYTMYNSEPFTHTGALATYAASDDLTFYGGWTFGWDSGFEDNGDSFLGGVSVALNENLSVTYMTTAGRFSRNVPLANGGDERGYMHSIVSDVQLTDQLQYIAQSDLLTTEGANGVTARDTFGLNNYLIYTVNDCFALGVRGEYWKAEGAAGVPVGTSADLYQLTLGANVKPHANVLIRPEVRWDWIDGLNAPVAAGLGPFGTDGDSQTTFGIDTIFLF